MTIKERDELLATATPGTLGIGDRHYHILRRIILALPVEADPPQPKPSMSQAVRELVRAAENCDQREWTAEEGQRLHNAIAAVKDLFVEEPE